MMLKQCFCAIFYQWNKLKKEESYAENRNERLSTTQLQNEDFIFNLLADVQVFREAWKYISNSIAFPKRCQCLNLSC